MLNKTLKVFILIISISLSSFSKTSKKDTRGLLPELQTNQETNEQENEVKNIKSELLISRTETKAINSLLKIIKKYKGTSQEPDLLNRLAELYMRKSKSG
ncbi:MAG: hypothetical protein KDD45_07570, partial [Bdellovibrionales bacterium]|nr:hypothetical protein [Bdellovibrionales bacterium]